MNDNITLLNGNCIELLKNYRNNSIDMIFADPPYNLSGENFVTTKNGKIVECNKGKWDIIKDIHNFNESWLKECYRILSPTGTIWITGTLHNHPSIGVTLKKLNFWILNDLIWYKKNAPPLLSCNRFVPSTELIWVASKSKKYFFNYHYAKTLNNGKQMRNLWEINAQRHITKHPTEKPEALIERILLIGSNENNLILDPFMGSGTTGVVCHKLKRKFIGIEIDEEYFIMAQKRIGLKTNVDLNDINKIIYPKNKDQLILISDGLKKNNSKKSKDSNTIKKNNKQY